MKFEGTGAAAMYNIILAQMLQCLELEVCEQWPTVCRQMEHNQIGVLLVGRLCSSIPYLLHEPRL